MTVLPGEQTNAAPVTPRTGRHRWLVAAAVTVVYLVVAVVEVRLFIVPRSDHPGPTDAVVVLGGSTYDIRLRAANRLIAEHPGAAEVVSTPNGLPCPSYHAPQASVLICFRPAPSTTQGEARAVAKLAAQYSWKSITVMTTADQVWRARLRFSRCWSGDLRVVQAPTTIMTRLLSAPYETAATIKAEIFQRGC
jgi:uncharacterized SAM-binding protein YcdF (DUF218 family)